MAASRASQLPKSWCHRIEQPNLRAALAHSITTGDLASAWRLAAALQRFWDSTGQRREAHELIQRALAIGDAPVSPRSSPALLRPA